MNFLDALIPMTILLGCLLGMYACARFVRTKLGVGARTLDPAQLKIVGKRQLDQRKALYVVEVADRYVLIGSTDHSLNLIDHITADEFNSMATPEPDPAEATPTVVAFGSLLDRARKMGAASTQLAEARRAARRTDGAPAEPDDGVVDLELASMN